jgi:hypothetical protein
MAGTYIVPEAVAENARRALEVRAGKPMSERGMTLVGLARANQLAKREPISLDTVRRMVAYFARHEVDKQGSTWDQQGRGWQAWYGWGGDEGRDWAKEILANEGDSMETKSMEYEGEFNIRQRMLAAALVEVTHEVGKFNKGMGADGAHYVSAESNPFIAQGVVCEDCYFYQPDGKCAIVDGDIEEYAVCKFWVIPETEIKEPMAESEVVEIPAEVSPARDSSEGNMPEDNQPMDEMTDETKVKLVAAEREVLPDEDFAIPSSRNFPITDPASIQDAVSSWGRYRGDVDFETFKRNLIKIAMRKGPEFYNALPQSWRDELMAAAKDLAKELLKRIQ